MKDKLRIYDYLENNGWYFTQGDNINGTYYTCENDLKLDITVLFKTQIWIGKTITRMCLKFYNTDTKKLHKEIDNASVSDVVKMVRMYKLKKILRYDNIGYS